MNYDDETTTLNFNDVLTTDKERHKILTCTNLDTIRFCIHYNVNIYNYIELAYSDSEH